MSDRLKERAAQKLREFAVLLEGEFLPAVVEQRVADLGPDLGAIYRDHKAKSDGLCDFIKSVIWSLEGMTVNGRTEMIRSAKKAAIELNEGCAADEQVSWRDVVRLPVADRDFLQRTARQLVDLADRLDVVRLAATDDVTEQPQGSQTSANSANKTEVFPHGDPSNIYVKDLGYQLEAMKGGNKSRNEIAREFVAEKNIPGLKWRSLLAMAERAMKQKD